MAIIRKYETVTDLRVYEVELTEDQLKVYLLDNDRFCDDIEGELDWDFAYDKIGNPYYKFELITKQLITKQ
jgi:hypothetical protein